MSDTQLLQPVLYVASLPSKDVRGVLIRALISDVDLKVSPAIVDGITALTTKLHTASLVLDDIEDGTLVRRESAAAHCVFGVPLSMNAASMSIFAAIMDFASIIRNSPLEADRSKELEAFRIVNEELVDLHRGQGQDILFREIGQPPTLDEYKAMAVGKTGGLFRLIVRLLFAFHHHADASERVEGSDSRLPATAVSSHNGNGETFKRLLNLSEEAGFWFQVMDDYLNLTHNVPPSAFSAATASSGSALSPTSPVTNSAAWCEDITEGKFSFPVAHHCACVGTMDLRLRHALRQHSRESEVKYLCLDLLRETDSLAYTKRIIDEGFIRLADIASDDMPKTQALLARLYARV